MKPKQAVLLASLAALLPPDGNASGPPPRKANLATIHGSLLTGGNGVYRIQLDSGCGAWTASTGPLHGAGDGKDLLFGDGMPGTSGVTVRSYSSGIAYSNAGTACRSLCESAPPDLSRIQAAGKTTGFTVTFELADGAAGRLRLTQEVNVEGPADGSETAGNSAIRESHAVTNLGTQPLRFGLRKLWDWQVDDDDGPWLAECATPGDACDRSLLLWGKGQPPARFPSRYVLNSHPATARCPEGVIPLAAGCGGVPPYLIAGTVEPPSPLMPHPDPPELLQFNAWSALFADCWQPALVDAAACDGGAGDDTATAYFYGASERTAEVLAPGERRTFTQYLVAATPAAGCLVLEPCRGPAAARAPASPCSLALGP